MPGDDATRRAGPVPDPRPWWVRERPAGAGVQAGWDSAGSHDAGHSEDAGTGARSRAGSDADGRATAGADGAPPGSGTSRRGGAAARRAGSLVVAGSRRSAARVRAAARADGADESGLAALITVHALSAAGDALVTVALAGTVFFSVPLGQARTRVGLYLLLTMLPFALLVPVAGPVLDRFPHGRRTVIAVTTGARGLVTWVMAGAIAGLGLYPLALAVLVLSRAYGVARSAALPRVRPPALGLVSANARLNIAAVSSTAVFAGLGGGLAKLTGSSRLALYLASVVLIAAGVLALRLPSQVDDPPEQGARTAAPRLRLTSSAPVVTGPLAAALALRALAGLLTIFLAFLLRADKGSPAVIGAVFGAAAVGQLAGTTVAARLPERAGRALSLLALALPLVTCTLAALSAATAWSVASAGAVGASSSLSKFALDASLQRHVATRSLSTAFSRSETALQLSWVLGGGLALALPTTRPAGFAAAALLPVLGVVGAWQLAVRAKGAPQAT